MGITAKSLFFATALLSMTTAAFCADVRGEWVVESVDRNGRITKTIFDFEVDGDRLTGSVLGYPENEHPISDGKISGNKISFILKLPVRNGDRSYMYIGRVDGDIIEFEVAALGGRGIPRREKMTAKRIRE